MNNSLLHFTALIALGISLTVGHSRCDADERPNVVLFIADDVSWNDFGCYGNSAARTPNIDRLASEGIRFNNAYLTASSCSPSRSSIVTGRYPHNNGKGAELHQPISVHLPWFPEVLRESGYYTALSGKHHMTTTKPGPGESPRPKPFDHVDAGRVPGDSSGSANWLKVLKDRPKDQPFFFWFASYDAHRGWDGDKQWDPSKYGPMHRAEDVIVPPFLSDDPETRSDLASYYNEVTRFDYRIGVVVDELRREGIFDNTLIFVLADNGRPFPRAKTRLHDSGMKTAFVTSWPKGFAYGSDSNSLVSVIDIAPTVLTAAGCEIPETMQGVAMQPLFKSSDASIRKYAFSEHNWHDYEAFGRSVRDGEYLYLINERVDLPWQGPADSVRSPSHQQLRKLRDEGKLSKSQADVFLSPRPSAALFKTADDPHHLENIQGDPAYAEVEARLAGVLSQWMDETGDSVPEKISPDTFDRETGDRLGKKQVDTEGAITPGEDRSADHVLSPGPR
ncbi:sulfatase [Stieleria sp. JC731]|uniref:sulfatase family protein n=1 Tax=Pirellulaceae TaxID=2691357 RepID=UPI001E2F05A1|nr:sulfatase [Stieleria sp. JC731]MCC9604156.1 sulfatase [Stieleria sp. JC731]